MTDSGFEGYFEKLERVRIDFASLVRELSDIPFAASGEGWSEPLSAWWARERGNAHPEVAALYENLVEHGRVLFLLAEQLGKPRGGDPTRDGADLMVLLETFQRSLGECLKASTVPGGEMFSPMSHLVDSWQQHAAHVFGLSRNPAQAFPDMLKARDAESLREAMSAFMHPAASAVSQLPGEPVLSLAAALVDYQDDFNRFARMAIEATGDAIARMEAALAAGDGEARYGVREFYDLWLACCEQTYDELSRDARFAKCMGELVNSAVQVHGARQRLSDAAAESLGLPTRRQVRELSASLYETRRRLARLERGEDSAGANPLARQTRPSVPLRRPANLSAQPGSGGTSVPAETGSNAEAGEAGKTALAKETSAAGSRRRGPASGARARSSAGDGGKAAKKKAAKKKSSKKKTAKKIVRKKTSATKRKSSASRRAAGGKSSRRSED